MKPHLAIDFDGTLVEHDPIYNPHSVGETIPGAIEFLRALSQKYTLVIFSARATEESGKKAIYAWIRRYNLRHIIYDVTNEKKYSYRYIIDDRAICFREANDYKLICAGLDCSLDEAVKLDRVASNQNG